MIIPREIHERWLAAGSSPVDWCEENYTVNDNIAEFTNTISNIILICLPIMMISVNVWTSFLKHVSIAPILMFLSLSFIGLASTYFHGTLSLLGQFLDDLSIAWTLCIGYAVLLPKRYKPVDVSEGMSLAVGLLVGVFMTCLWFASPLIYSFWLWSATIPAFGMVILELTVYRTPSTLSITRWAFVLFAFAVILWFLDKLMCNFVLSLGFPGTHQIYHLLTPFGSYLTITLLSFWKAQDYAVNVKSTIKYFPGTNWGLPYVHCEKMAA